MKRCRKLPSVGIKGFLILMDQAGFCWSDERVLAAWRVCGEPKRFTALDILERASSVIGPTNAQQGACLLLPADLCFVDSFYKGCQCPDCYPENPWSPRGEYFYHYEPETLEAVLKEYQRGD